MSAQVAHEPDFSNEGLEFTPDSNPDSNGGVVYTPPPDPVLQDFTREVCRELARRHGDAFDRPEAAAGLFDLVRLAARAAAHQMNTDFDTDPDQG